MKAGCWNCVGGIADSAPVIFEDVFSCVVLDSIIIFISYLTVLIIYLIEVGKISVSIISM